MKKLIYNRIQWIFGGIFLMYGILFFIAGNNSSLAILIFSSIYFPPVTSFFQKKFGLNVPNIIKIALATFIIWGILVLMTLYKGQFLIF